MRPDDSIASPLIVYRVGALKVSFAVPALERVPTGEILAGVTAVIETAEGVSYWALSHPGAKPDFHDSKAFLVRF